MGHSPIEKKKIREFQQEFDIFVENYLKFVEDVQRYERITRIYTQEAKNTLKEFNQKVSALSEKFENFIALRDSPYLTDPYFFHMRKQELKGFRKELSRLIQAFTELKRWMEKNNRRKMTSIKLIEEKKREENIFEIQEDDYARLFLKFLRENLEYTCPRCKQIIGYGDPECENCGTELQWEFNRDEIWEALSSLPSGHKFYCPDEECHAPIMLDWENCAYCGLDLQRVFSSEIIFL